MILRSRASQLGYTRVQTERQNHVNQGDQAVTSADVLFAEVATDWLRLKRRRRIGTWVFRALVLLLLLALAAGVYRQFLEAPSTDGGPYTVVIPLTGPVFDGDQVSHESLRERLSSALADERTAGIILRIDSPGGSPVQAGLMYDEITRVRQEHPDVPVHALIGNVAASAGYYIASAADQIFANQASLVGSIGVRLDAFGAEDAMQRLGFERRLLTAGEHKGLFDPFLPLDELAGEHMQGVLDSVHQQFIDAVQAGRGDRLVDDPALFSGLVWSGAQAKDLGLVDDLMDQYTIAEDIIGAEEVRELEPPQTLFERVSDEVAGRVALLFWQQLQLR